MSRRRGLVIGLRRFMLIAPFALGWSMTAGCSQDSPSTKLREKLSLPEPTAVTTPLRETRLNTEDRGESYVLTPYSLIPIAFNRQPNIKSSYQRFKSEEGRYDFFYSSRDSLTPKVSLSNDWEESLDDEEIERYRDHTAELSLEKRFFDTSQVDIGLGHSISDENQEFGRQPFMSAKVRYPLWASRERLERTSEEIFRRSELNDAQLAFIQTVRGELENALNVYYRLIYHIHLRAAATSRREDLEGVLSRIKSGTGEEALDDQRRIEAELTSAVSTEESYDSLVRVLTARLKAACGLPFHAEIKLVEQPFDPFEGMSHEELLRLGLDSDPEIATLRNSMSNARVQLDLARRGRWDVAFLANGRSTFRGAGEHEGEAEWAVSVGLEVSAVDTRVTSSLIRQAQADIERFGEAIAARENAIFADTLEPLVRNKTLGENNKALRKNLEKFRADYSEGVTDYLEARLGLDDLLARLDKIYGQQVEIATQSYYIGVNVAALCAATGQFFELLNGSEDITGMQELYEKNRTHRLAGDPDPA